MVTEIRGVVFDIDDTLYLERDYVRSGLRHVCDAIAKTSGIDGTRLFVFLWELFESGQRGHLFDALLKEHPQVASRWSTPDLVKAYREHVPTISLAPEIGTLLQRLRSTGMRLGVITDGALASQTAKIAALGLDARVDVVCTTDSWGAAYWKPHPRSFVYVASALDLLPVQLAYVGDNPHKDFVAPLALGWDAVRLRIPGQLHVNAESCGVVEVQSVEQLASYLMTTTTSNE